MFFFVILQVTFIYWYIIVSQSISESSAAELPQVRVKEIQVKQLDKNVSQLRSFKRNSSNNYDSSLSRIGENFKGSRPSSPSYMNNGYSNSSSNNSGGSNGNNSNNNPLAENVLSLLNTCISRVIKPSNHPVWNNLLDAYQNFMSLLSLQSQSLEYDTLMSEVLIEIQLSSNMLSSSCIISTKQYWKLSDLFITVLISSPYTSIVFTSCVDAFLTIGYSITQKDPHSSLSLFYDFTLFKLINLINNNVYKRYGILKILLSFLPNETQYHVQCIKKLQVLLIDMNIFIHCLTILAILETKLNNLMLDLYIYYANIGLSLSNPKLRGKKLC